MRADYPWARRRRRQASFRGAKFEVLTQERSTGHRVQVHTYPYIDTPYSEDLGRSPRGYRLDALVSGPDYDRDLKRLERALERRGRGRLTLWYGDPVSVVVQRARIVERSDAQGFALLSIEFVEAGRPVNPESRAGRSLIDRAVAAVRTAATSAFPGVAANVAKIGSLGSRMFDLGGDLKGELEDTLDRIDRNAGQASDAATSLSDFGSRLATLATDAGGLATAVSGIIDDLVALPVAAMRRFMAIGALIGWGDGLDPIDTSTGIGRLASDNQRALSDLVARLASAHLAAISTQIEFESADDAARHRETLAGLLDGVLIRAADVGDDDTYSELRAAKALAVSDLDARAARLPVRVEITLAADTPSIVLGWRLYADPERGPELARRHGTRHPAFMPGGVPMEVLSEARSG